jgi:hypothetical protein
MLSGNYDFNKDLAVAVKTEDEVADFLVREFGFLILERSNRKYYDIKAEKKGKTYLFEIKEDMGCKRTGNVALEFDCRGRPSGISITKADLYIYKIHRPTEIVFLVTKTSTLKKMVKDRKHFTIVCGGDTDSHSMNYLFKYEVFVKEGKIIKNIPT